MTIVCSMQKRYTPEAVIESTSVQYVTVDIQVNNVHTMRQNVSFEATIDCRVLRLALESGWTVICHSKIGNKGLHTNNSLQKNEIQS